MFSASWSPDDALTLAAAGSKGKLQIWDISTNGGARKSFAQKLKEANRTVKEKQGDGLIGVTSDDEDDTMKRSSERCRKYKLVARMIQPARPDHSPLVLADSV